MAASVSGSATMSSGRLSRDGFGLVLLLWLLIVAWMMAKLPHQATPTGDTEAYVALASYRPPLYGWALNTFRWATGSLDYLPAMQFALFAAGLLLFALELGRLLGSPLAAAAAILLVPAHQNVYESFSWMMTESLFETLLLAGLGLQFRNLRSGGAASLAGAAACFALTAGTRTTGAVFLLVPLVAVCLDRRTSPAAAAARAGRVAIVGGLVLVTFMAGNWMRNGRFEIGSWTGISLMGKGLLLTEPSDVSGSAATPLGPPLQAVLPAAEQLRRVVAAQPDIGAILRAQDQAYQDLRYEVFYPAAEQGWPAWRAGDFRERGELALAMSRRLIARHPRGYLGLWANDWVSLVVYPTYWPAWATAQADPALFPSCREHRNCWVLTRYDVPARTIVAMLAVSLAAVAGGGLLVVVASWRVLRRRAAPVTVLFWSIAVVFHASILATSAFEFGVARYTTGTHILGVALLLWFISIVPPQIGPPAGWWRRQFTWRGRPASGRRDPVGD